MNLLDIILIIVVSIGAIKGFIKGAIAEVFGLLAILLGIWFTATYHPQVQELIEVYFQSEHLEWITYILCFLSVYVLTILVSKIITKTISALALGPINRILGAVVGGSKLLIVSLLLVLVTYFAFQYINKPSPKLLSDSKTIELLIDFEVIDLANNSLNSR